MKEYTSETAGICAICNSENITYGDTDFDNGQVSYSYTCRDCKNDGIEYYSLEYIETIAYKIK